MQVEVHGRSVWRVALSTSLRVAEADVRVDLSDAELSVTHGGALVVDALQLDDAAPAADWQIGLSAQAADADAADAHAVDALEVVDATVDGEVRTVDAPFAVSINAQQFPEDAVAFGDQVVDEGEGEGEVAEAP